MSRTALPIRFEVGGRRVRGETLHSAAGAEIVNLTSCSAELGLELRSAYVGGERCDRVQVAESAVVGHGPAELLGRVLEGAGDALLDERRRLLYDHLQRLQELALSDGCQLAFTGVDEAAAQLDPHSSPSR